MDYDPTSLDLIHEAMKEYKWICNRCRDSAKLARSGKNKNKLVGGARSVEDSVLRDLSNQISTLNKRVISLETDLKMIKSTAAKNNQPLTDSVIHGQSDVFKNNLTRTPAALISVSSTATPPDTVTAVHRVIKDVKRRKCNVVVSGLRPISDVNDDLLFKSLCESYFSVVPSIIKSRCIDKISSSPGAKPSRLLVHLGPEAIAWKFLCKPISCVSRVTNM